MDFCRILANIHYSNHYLQLERQVMATTSPTIPRETQIKLKKAAKGSCLHIHECYYILELVSSQTLTSSTSKSSEDDIIFLDSDDDASTSFCEFVTSWTTDEDTNQDADFYQPSTKRFR